jgi:hypothetical protein
MDDPNEMLVVLERRAAELEAEALRYRTAAAVLRGERPPSDLDKFVGRHPRPNGRGRKPSANGTKAMAKDLLAALGPISPPELARAMLGAGWVTDSENPANTLRTSLRRMADHGEVIAYSNGKYGPVPSNESDND